MTFDLSNVELLRGRKESQWTRLGMPHTITTDINNTCKRSIIMSNDQIPNGGAGWRMNKNLISTLHCLDRAPCTK